MKVLNLYAGLGGNRKLWEADVTAIERDPMIASLYQRFYPQDKVREADAHQWLLDHHSEYDFIWSSPPCQSHSRMVKGTRHKKPRYADLSLYEEILFLQHNHKGPWVVENVVPYYRPLVEPSIRIGRHLFWSNLPIEPCEEPKAPKDFINRCNLEGKKALQEWLGIHYEENVYYGKNHCPAQILRNCVHPLIGQHVFNQALNISLSPLS